MMGSVAHEREFTPAPTNVTVSHSVVVYSSRARGEDEILDANTEEHHGFLRYIQLIPRSRQSQIELEVL